MVQRPWGASQQVRDGRQALVDLEVSGVFLSEAPTLHGILTACIAWWVWHQSTAKLVDAGEHGVCRLSEGKATRSGSWSDHVARDGIGSRIGEGQ